MTLLEYFKASIQDTIIEVIWEKKSNNDKDSFTV